jgi:hypothetical protein
MVYIKKHCLSRNLNVTKIGFIPELLMLVKRVNFWGLVKEGYLSMFATHL